MIKIDLIAHTNVDPIELASHAALICYQASVPEMGNVIDVNNRLFKVGHHTTLQHFFVTFVVDGISVGDITLGMHLTSPFYNSDQRSGRYCSKMFLDTNFESIEKYIKSFWKISPASMKKIMTYVKKGVSLYHENIQQATEISRDSLKSERPYANEKYLEMNAPKIAQEQMRMFIPVIFPTAFDFTVNLSSLVAMYEAAWTPVMRYVTEKMAALVVEKFPQIGFMFKNDRRTARDWSMAMPEHLLGVSYKPEAMLVDCNRSDICDLVNPEVEDVHPVDRLHFIPEMMNNSVVEIKTFVELSLATMGQDQRHRTIKRGMPKFTGNFYIPPILRKMRLEKSGINLMEQWMEMSKKIAPSLAMILAPYGAMVFYKKVSSLNALRHEQGKRLCWCAQEEIYHIGRALRMEIQKKLEKNSSLLSIFEPPCYRTGICGEGDRFCGRDRSVRKTGDYFTERVV